MGPQHSGMRLGAAGAAEGPCGGVPGVPAGVTCEDMAAPPSEPAAGVGGETRRGAMLAGARTKSRIGLLLGLKGGW